MPRRGLLLPPVLAVEEGAHPPGAERFAPRRDLLFLWSYASFGRTAEDEGLRPSGGLLLSLNKSRQKSA